MDCYVEHDKQALVDIFISIIIEYRVYLKNLSINQFSKLIKAAKRTAASVRLTTPNRGEWRSEKREALLTLIATKKKLPVSPM